MNFGSPSNIMKSLFTNQSLSSNKNNSTNILTDSPESPSFLPKLLSNKEGKRISRSHQPSALSINNLNSVETELKDKDSYDSPTTTLAADLCQNFRIRDTRSDDVPVPTPKRPLKFDCITGSGLTNDLLDSISSSKDGFDMNHSFSQSPLMNKTLEIKKPVLEKENSRATSISSLNSIMSTTSMSSMDTETDKFPFPLIQKQPNLRRSKTLFTKTTTTSSNDSIFNNPSNSFRSSEGLLPGFNDIDDDSNQESNSEEESPLDILCSASPVPPNKQHNRLSQDDFSNRMKREIGSPGEKKDIRAKVRRTHSMFHTKKDISDTTQRFGNLMGSPDSPNFFNEKGDNITLSNSILHKSGIKTFKVKNDQLPRVDSAELCRILDGKFKESFDEIIIVDCRFEYEFNGGHIEGAINIPSQEELEKRFLSGNRHQIALKVKESNFGSFGSKASKTLVIFHCEYSSYRGPSMALHLRSCDRNLNQDHYPHLDFPDILILEGGYKNFFENHSTRCFPQQYVKMNHENHKENNERGMKKFRKDFKRASSFNNLSYSSNFQQTRTHTRTLSSHAIQFNSASTAIAFNTHNRAKSLFESGFRTSSAITEKIPLSLDLISDDEETEGVLPFKFPINPDEIPSQSPSVFADFMKEEDIENFSEEEEDEMIFKRKVLERSKTMKY